MINRRAYRGLGGQAIGARGHFCFGGLPALHFQADIYDGRSYAVFRLSVTKRRKWKAR